MWIVGKDNGNTWVFKGVYCSECKAALRTEDETWFIAKVVLNQYIHSDGTEEHKKYYPRKK